MEFFKDFGRQVSDIAKNIGKRTGEAAEVGRLNARKQGIRQQIEELYRQIGKAYYDTRESSEHETSANLCMQVSILLHEMKKLDDRIDEIRCQRRCSECGQVQPSNARFCANCGARLIMDEVQSADKGDTLAKEGNVPEEDASRRDEVAVEISWPEPERCSETDELEMEDTNGEEAGEGE